MGTTCPLLSSGAGLCVLTQFEGTWNELSAKVGQMSEAPTAVAMVTPSSYHTSLPPLILLQSERGRAGAESV